MYQHSRPSMTTWSVAISKRQEALERWKKIKGYPCYEVSDFGRVRRSLNWKRPSGRGSYNSFPGMIRRQFVEINGYPCVTIYDRGKPRRFLVHTLVASAFVGRKPNGKDVNHKDGIKTNNHYSNLNFMSRSKNVRHGIKMGLRKSGEKLTVDDVAAIRESPSRQSHRELAKRYGVSEIHIYNIRRGFVWRQALC